MALSPLCRCPERAAPRGLALFSLHALFKGKFGSEPGSCAPVIFFIIIITIIFLFSARRSLYFFIKLHPPLKACIQIAIYNLFTDPSPPSRTRGWQQAPRPPSAPPLLPFPFCFSSSPRVPSQEGPCPPFPPVPRFGCWSLTLRLS